MNTLKHSPKRRANVWVKLMHYLSVHIEVKPPGKILGAPGSLPVRGRKSLKNTLKMRSWPEDTPTKCTTVNLVKVKAYGRGGIGSPTEGCPLFLYRSKKLIQESDQHLKNVGEILQNNTWFPSTGLCIPEQREKPMVASVHDLPAWPGSTLSSLSPEEKIILSILQPGNLIQNAQANYQVCTQLYISQPTAKPFGEQKHLWTVSEQGTLSLCGMMHLFK